ncbi:MAG: flagellar hook-length control protein FliK [Sulfuricurvum sp.]|nr:flagellar hook-length control protein FliK [Sulfuricurvum sp.]
MIVQSKEAKSQKSLIDLLGGNAKTSIKRNDLFSKLLTAFKMGSENTKEAKTNDFKAVIDPKNSAILGGDEKELALVSKELLATFSDDQVRTLIHKAKEYLKNEIAQKAPEYQSDTTKLSKSLIGLVQLAQKLGLEPESITLSTLKIEPEETNTLPIELLTKPLLESKMLATLPALESSSAQTTPFEVITQLLSEVKSKEQKILSSNQTPKEETEKTKSQPLKALLQTLENRLENTQTPSIKSETEKPSESKSVVSLAPKSDTLIALLQGEIDGNLMKSSPMPKAVDSIEVKVKEAQQSMRHFAGELKEAVQEYKPPFTRLTMKLNPEKLGEVEVTLVQRGNNVHVNIQSNNTTTVAFLAHNATELKAQLAHQGITNATMNFMSGGESQQQSSAQQQQQDHQQNRYRVYQSFEELELNEEQLSALEIIIPHYA